MNLEYRSDITEDTRVVSCHYDAGWFLYSGTFAKRKLGFMGETCGSKIIRRRLL
jgi:hypothetical protein